MDDDWMIPRHLHSAEGGASEEHSGGQIKIDPKFLRQRQLRKERLVQHPAGRTAEELLSDFDRSISRSAPSFPDRMWTLGDTARWVIERTPAAVNGLSIDEEELFEILPEIQSALSDGEILVFANTKTDPVPRELPPETWSVYELVVEEKNGLLRIFPLSQDSSDYEQHLLNVRVKRDSVLQRWPASSSAATPVRPTTAGAENQCRRWLVAMMDKQPTQPTPKAVVLEEALAKFPGLSKRAFDRAWTAAIRETDAQKWAAPGRRS